LVKHCRSILEAEAIAAFRQDAKDSEYQAEVAAGDAIVGEGIDTAG